MTETEYPEPVDDPYMAAILPIVEKPSCDCEYVDIGVGHQRVTDNPECPKHSAFGQASAVLGALAKAGLLLSFGGEVREERGYVTAMGPRLAAWSSEPATIRRNVTSWPDGSVLIGPWSPIPEVTS